MPAQVALVLKSVLEDYALPWRGIHGVAHWARVFENGVTLAQTTGANLEVVKLFAILHDSRRLNEDHDPDHGPRAAQLARSLRGSLLELSEHDFHLLCIACEGHTHQRTHPDVTIQTCWDADRLDLGRVGITPHPSRLCTDVAKLQSTIQWAHERALADHVPEFVKSAWNLDLQRFD